MENTRSGGTELGELAQCASPAVAVSSSLTIDNILDLSASPAVAVSSSLTIDNILDLRMVANNWNNICHFFRDPYPPSVLIICVRPCPMFE